MKLALALASAVLALAVGFLIGSSNAFDDGARERPPASNLDQILGPVGRGDLTMDVAIKDGLINGSDVLTVPFDHRLTLHISSDVDEELHVDGYHLFVKLHAGETTTAYLWSGTQGVYTIYLENRKQPIGRLSVEAKPFD
jgi:hypothetical protein